VFECVKPFRSCRFCESIPWLLIVLFNTLTLHSLHSQVPCPVAWGPTLQISNTPSSAFVPKLAVVGDTVHVAYVAGHLYYQRSTDAGLTWSDAIIIQTADSLPGSIGSRIMAASGNGVYVLWSKHNSGGGLVGIDLRRSTDAGGTWLPKQELVRSPLFEAPIVSAYSENLFVRVRRNDSVGNYYLTRSTDSGATWDSLRQITVMAETHGSLGDIRATANAVHLVFERAVQPSGREIAHMSSTDRGDTWSNEQVLSTLDAYQAWEPNVAADDEGNVYVSWQDAKYGTVGGFDGFLLLRRSTDNGNTWQPEDRIGSLPSVERSALAVSGERVHAAWEDNRFGGLNPRVYYSGSTNQDTTWCEEMMLGDSNLVSLNTAVGARETDVHAVWSMRIPSIAQVHFRRGDIITNITEKNHTLLERFAVTPFYPNPFNPSTRVEYTVPYREKMTIIVYDVLGRKVKNLFDGIQSAGVFQVDFDGTNFASGIYFVRFHFGTHIITRGVILMR